MFFVISLIFTLFTSEGINAQLGQPTFLGYFCQNDRGNYTANSTYRANLNHLLSTVLLSGDGNGHGFYNASYGRDSDISHAIGLCRGDIFQESNIRRHCLNVSRTRLANDCPNQKNAVIWYDECMLRYSNASLLAVPDTSPKFYMRNNQSVPFDNMSTFFQNLGVLLVGLRDRAATGGSLQKYAAGTAKVPGFETIYALVQCKPDLSHKECKNCLDGAFEAIPNVLYGKVGGRELNPSCNFRYEVYPFYEAMNDSPPFQPPSAVVSHPPPPAPTVNTASQGQSNISRIAIKALVPTVVSAVLIISICAGMKMKTTKKNGENHAINYECEEEIRSVEVLQFDFNTIKSATNNFSEQNKIGQGGFGAVYKGRLVDGQDIAVKRLSWNFGQGDIEFKNEVLLVTKLQHRNLIRLIGFCLRGHEKILVYEFVPNASLDHFIFDPIKRGNFHWDMRYKVIEGIARGLLYLHVDSRLRIIHRDVKASNILLDEEMNPKISDFGLAKSFVVDQTQGNTCQIVGTFGYMAPEYAMHGQFSVKSDVFSFGVLILEIMSGQRNDICFRHGEQVVDLLSYAWINLRDGTASSIVDPLIGHSSGPEIIKCIHIGLLCVQENIANRPTMNSIVLMLNSDCTSLPLPSEPAFFMNSRTANEAFYRDSSSAASVQVSALEASITEMHSRSV